MCGSEAGLATAGNEVGRVLVEKRCVTKWKIFGVSRVAAGGDKRPFANALAFIYTVFLEQPGLKQPRKSMASAVILV